MTNTGDRAGDEVVQLYTRQRRSRVKQPLRQLRGFDRVPSRPARQTVHPATADRRSVLSGRHLGGPVVEDATHTLIVGRSARDIRAVDAVTVHAPPRRRSSPAPAVPAGGGAR